MKTRRILIVDDHRILADAIKTMIEADFSAREIRVEVKACTSIKACSEILLAEGFDLVLMDLGLPDLPREPRPAGLGIYMVRTFAQTPVIVMSGTDDDATIQQCKTAGARGFLSKGIAPSDMMHAIDAAFEPGEFFAIAPQTNTLQKKRAQSAANESSGKNNGIDAIGLTPRQLEVLALMLDGRSNKEIAARFGLSEGTVKIHVRFVLEKLGIERRLQAKDALEARGIELPVLQDQAA